MPTNHVGDKALTQAPSAKPGPEGTITVALPADGDPPNASTFAQAYKALADWADWLLKPQGVTSLATKYIQRWKTSDGQTRFALDRNGMPAATVLQLQEWWPATLQHSLALNYDVEMKTAVTGWTRKLVGGANLFTYGPGSGRQEHGFLWLLPYLVTGDFASAASPPLARIHSFLDCAVEFPAALGLTVWGCETLAGIGQLADAGVRTKPGLWFGALMGSPNWQAISSDGSSETVEDTGVPANGAAWPSLFWQRFRIEYRGSNANGGSAAAHFFINGAHVKTITTTLPTATALPGAGGGSDPVLSFVGSCKVLGSGLASAESLFVGPVNVVCNLMPQVA